MIHSTLSRLLSPLLTLCVAVGCVVVGCVDVPAAADFADQRCAVRVDGGSGALQLAAVLPVTGADGAEDAAGVARSRAIELAVRKANDLKGVQGRKFTLRVCDCGGAAGERATRAGAIATWLVGSADAPAALLTGGTAETLAVHEASKASGTLVVSVSSTAIDVTDWDDDGLLWRVSPSDRLQGLAMVHVLSKAKAAKVTVLASADPYGDSLTKVIKDSAPDGMTITASSVTAENVTSKVESAAADKPDHVVVISDTALGAKVLDAVTAQAALASAGLVLSDALKRTQLFGELSKPDALVGAQGTTPGDPPSTAFDTFKSQFEDLFKTDATQQSYTAHAYDAAWCLMLAHAWALRDGGPGLSGKGLAEGLGKLAEPGAEAHTLEPTSFSSARKALLAGKPIDVTGASGPLDFDTESGEPTSAVEVWQVGSDKSFASQYWVRIGEDKDGKPTFTEIPPK